MFTKEDIATLRKLVETFTEQHRVASKVDDQTEHSFGADFVGLQATLSKNYGTPHPENQ